MGWEGYPKNNKYEDYVAMSLKYHMMKRKKPSCDMHFHCNYKQKDVYKNIGIKNGGQLG